METNNVTQWVIIGAAVVVLIVGGAWLAMRGGADRSTDTNATATTTASTTPVTTVDSSTSMPKNTVTATSDGETVSVAANQVAGDTVTLSSMSLTRASWVAVRDDKSILGAAWFPSNATTGTVELQRATESGKSYNVVIYVDDGDKKFDMHADQLVTADGGPVGVSFKAE